MILILFGVALFLVGGILGVVYQSHQTDPQLEKETTVIKTLSSEMIPSITAYGEVTSIDGQNITLSYAGNTMTVSVADGVKVFSFVKTSEEKEISGSGSKEVEFKDIKKGDTLNINLKLMSDGQLKSQSVIILSSATQ